MQVIFTEARQAMMTLDGHIAAEDCAVGREPGWKGLRDMIAPFLADDDGRHYPLEQAKAVLGEMTSEQIRELGQAFAAAMAAIPNESESRSSSTQSTGDQDPTSS